MKFFFDNNLSPHFARSFAALSVHEEDVQAVAHLRDAFPGNTPDTEWLAALSDGGDKWNVISGDKFKKDKRAEREAIRRAGHTVYVLDPQWSEKQYWDKAARLTLWWPLILAHARLTAGGVHRVQWRHTAHARFHTM